MVALGAGVTEFLSDKLTLGYSDNPRVVGLAFLETHFLWSPLSSMDATLIKHPRVIFYLNCTSLQ